MTRPRPVREMWCSQPVEDSGSGVRVADLASTLHSSPLPPGFPPGQSASPLVTHPQTFPIPAQRAKADRVPGTAPSGGLPQLLRDPRFPHLPHGHTELLLAALEALSPEQGGQEHRLEPKIKAARGLGWVGEGHFYIGIYYARVGRGRW